MRTIAFSLVALGAFLMLPGVSWADSGCGPNEPIGGGQCLSFSEGSASLQTTVVPASTTMAIQGFNPALGTLDEVDCLDCADGETVGGGTATMTITVTNLFPEPFVGQEAFIFISVGTPSGAPWINGLDEFSCGIGPLAAGEGQTTDCADHSFELSSSPLVSPTDLASFISTGSVFAPVSLDRGSGPLADFGETVTIDSVSMTVNVDVGYVYTPTIPEPASGILLLTAALIVGPLLWNRKRRFVAR